MLPDSNNKLTVKWKGPFKVVEKKGPVNYKTEIKEGLQKVYHINTLNEYIRREPDWWKVDKEVVESESQRDVEMERNSEEDEVHEIATVASVVHETNESEEVQQVKENMNVEL